jgi:hypothetical protein
MSNPSQPAIQLGPDALLRLPRGAERSGSEVQVRTRWGLRSWAAAYRERHRVNRAFRRQQREFQQAFDACEHSPSGQRDLQTMWNARD